MHRRRISLTGAAVVFSAFSLAATTLLNVGNAHAQTSVPLGEFSANRFSPSVGGSSYLSVDSARVIGHWNPTVALYADYAHRPFVIYDAECADDDATNCTLGSQEVALVDYALTLHVLGSISLWDRVMIGVDLPVAYSRTEGFDFERGGEPLGFGGSSGFALSDVRFSVKGRIYGLGEGPAFAAVAYATIPTGQATADGRFMGDNGPIVGGHFVAEFVQSGFRVALNFGGLYRKPVTLFSTEVGSEMTYSMAAGYDVTTLVNVFGEVQGASTFSSNLDENPLEARVGARLRQGDFVIGLGVGAGLISGVGVPQVRGGLEFAWAPDRGDSDQDNVIDQLDLCPSDPEDADNWEDDDGCPELDNDRDNLNDEVDRCPNEAEDFDNQVDDDGCPDADNDGDGIIDDYDSCPAEAEDVDGDRDDDGCPDSDRDRDGVPDETDRCPDEAEDTDGFGDDDGCPETDFDQDSITDDQDQCPDEAEDKDNWEDEDGCPEEATAPVRRGRPR